MRLMLASIECQKGELRANVDRHITVMSEARQARCDLVVFPEFSLTGSVDPKTHAERAIPIEHWAVNEILLAGESLGVAAVFGLAEQLKVGFSITQAYTVNGQLAGVQRKRHLGEGEEHYTAATATTIFQYGAARFGSIICAESGVNFTWDQTFAAGASLIEFCSAPGL